MDLSIIIVNWNSVKFTQDCLASIQRTVRDLKYEVIVVDNASRDRSCEILSEAFPWVKLIRSDRNLGFARANNLGAEHARAGRYLFLNPDTLVLGEAIRRMVCWLDSAPEIGAVGGRLLNADLTLQTSCVQPMPNILNQILALDWLKRRWPKLPLWGMQALFSGDPGSLQEVEVVSGACLMVKEDAFREVGGFSTEYFMYAEEVDLCCKVRCAGWKVSHVGEAQVIHFGGQSSKQRRDHFADVVMRESIFRFLRKFRGTVYAQTYRFALFLSAVLRLSILSPLLLAPNRFLDRQGVVCAFRKWCGIAWWCLVPAVASRRIRDNPAVEACSAQAQP